MSSRVRLSAAFLLYWLSVQAQAHHDDHKGGGSGGGLNLPTCVSDCITQDSSCNAADLKCICRTAAQGSLLTDVVACIYHSGDDDCSPQQTVSVDILFGPLELACGIIGKPIPSSAIASAEAAQSSIIIGNPVPSSTLTSTITSPTTTGSSAETKTETFTATTKTTAPKTTAKTSSTSSQNTATAATSTSSSPETQLSSATDTQTTSDSTTESTTTTTTHHPVDPTDGSPFALPIPSGGMKEIPSLLYALLAWTVLVTLSW